MASVKLTNWDRDNIVRAAGKGAFAARRLAHEAAGEALAFEAYAFIVTPAEQKAIAKLPARWWKRDKCLRFNVEGQRITLNVPEPGVLVPPSSGGYCETLGAITEGDLCSRIQAHAQAGEALKAEQKDAEAKVKALVYSVTTTAKLREVWPEGEAFYDGIESRSPSSLPMVRVAEVNAALGIAA